MNETSQSVSVTGDTMPEGVSSIADSTETLMWSDFRVSIWNSKPWNT